MLNKKKSEPTVGPNICLDMYECPYLIQNLQCRTNWAIKSDVGQMSHILMFIAAIFFLSNA